MKILKVGYVYEKSNLKGINYCIVGIALLLVFLWKYGDKYKYNDGMAYIFLALAILICLFIRYVSHYVIRRINMFIKNNGQKEKAIINKVKVYVHTRNHGSKRYRGLIQVKTSKGLCKRKYIKADVAFDLLERCSKIKGEKIEIDTYIYCGKTYVDLSSIKFKDIIEKLKT